MSEKTRLQIFIIDMIGIPRGFRSAYRVHRVQLNQSRAYSLYRTIGWLRAYLSQSIPFYSILRSLAWGLMVVYILTVLSFDKITLSAINTALLGYLALRVTMRHAKD